MGDDSAATRASNGRDRERSHADVRAEFVGTELARHLALFYDSRDAQLEVAAAFIDHGLRSDCRCIYLTDVNGRREIVSALRAANVDVDGRLDAGDLVIRDATDVYLDGGFDPARMIETLETACDDSVAEGYDGLWAAGENTWSFHLEKSFDHILEFEADFDARCPDLPVTALCQYDLTQFGERSIAKALWTHKQIVYRRTLCENPYYIPPEEYTETASPRLNARLMLEQTHTLARSRREIERREQRLAVVNRVLRHNIRNDLNTILGTLSLLAETQSLDEEGRERLAVCTEYGERIVEMAEKARYVQRTIGDATVEAIEIEPLLRTAVREVEERYPEAEIAVAGQPRGTVLVDTNFGMALVEALTWLLDNQPGDGASVTLSVSPRSTAIVALEISAPGPSIPRSDQRALLEGSETPLEHGSGLGLWLVKWIVENANGRVRFPEDCTLRIDLHRALD